jgi:hypothetical protein
MTRSSFARATAFGFTLTFLRSSVLRVADPRSVQEASWDLVIEISLGIGLPGRSCF